MDQHAALQAEARRTGIRFAVATREDEAAIRRLLRENAMAGIVRLTFEREPDYFRGADLAGANDEAIVAFDRERLVCVGRCSRRDCWVNGHVTRTGYLAELRLDASARGRFSIVRDGYRFFHAQPHAKETAMHFTSIAADNFRAQRLLERGARGMPAYGFLADLVTLLVAVPRSPRAPRLQITTATRDDLPTILRLLEAHGRRHQLAAAWTGETLLALARHGLPLERFLLAFVDGVPVACGALWDQRGFRQTVIHGYSLGGLRPVYNLLAPLFSAPRLPRLGGVLAQAFLSPLACAEEAAPILPDFVAAFLPLARQLGLDFLTLALPADDPRLPVLRRRFPTRTYLSRLYRVDWPGERRHEMRVEGARFLPAVALL